MRIGIVCPYNYFRPGGVQICIAELTKELTRRGHYVRIIAPTPKVLPTKVPKNIILLGSSTEVNTPFHTKADFGVSVSNERLDTLLRDERFDILHVHEPGIPMLGAQLLGRSKARNVATMHATLPDGMISKSFEKLMTPFAKYIEPKLHGISAVSEVAKNISLGYAPHAHITVIPNGIALSDYVPAEPRSAVPNKGTKTILYIGRLERRKGVINLLKAYARLRKTHDDVRLVIAGDGKLRPRLEAKVAKEKIPDVSFEGFISEKRKIKLLRSADLYCSPALFGESFGIVLLEAMAAECVLVAGNNPGYAGVMTGRGKISLVDPKDDSSFMQRMELLLYDSEIRGLWLEWARDYVKQFDYPKIVDKYEELYERALKQ